MGWDDRITVEQGKLGSQVKIAWSESRIRDLEFFRVRGEHEAGRVGGGKEFVDLRELREKVTKGRKRESERGWSHLISQRS